MSNRRNRIEKLERENAAHTPVQFVFCGSLKRGEKPRPGTVTFVLDHPEWEGDPAAEPEDSSNGAHP